MQIEYTVHSVTEEPVPVQAMLGDRKVLATIPGLTVELVNANHGHTFRFLPEDMGQARAMFAEGARVTATFTAGEPA